MSSLTPPLPLLLLPAWPACRYPSGESYMDVIQRLEPVVTGGCGLNPGLAAY